MKRFAAAAKAVAAAAAAAVVVVVVVVVVNAVFVHGFSTSPWAQITLDSGWHGPKDQATIRGTNINIPFFHNVSLIWR